MTGRKILQVFCMFLLFITAEVNDIHRIPSTRNLVNFREYINVCFQLYTCKVSLPVSIAIKSLFPNLKQMLFSPKLYESHHHHQHH